MEKAPDYFIVDPAALDETEKKFLAWRIYKEAHVKIFAEPGFEEFYKTVFNPPEALLTKLIIHIHDSNIIGYTTFHAFEINVKEEKVIIVMSEMGVVAQEKNHVTHLPTHLFLNELIKLVFHKPLAKIFIIDSLVSPILYRRSCKAVHEFYPRVNQKLPLAYSEIIASAANHFHWNIEKRANFFIRHHLLWQLQHKYIQFANDEAKYDENVKFFNNVIPNKAFGDGLIIFIPITLANLLLTVSKMLMLSVFHKWKTTKLPIIKKISNS